MEEHIGQIMDVERLQTISKDCSKKVKKHLLFCALLAAVNITSLCILNTDVIKDRETTNAVGLLGFVFSGGLALGCSALLGEYRATRKKADAQIHMLTKE